MPFPPARPATESDVAALHALWERCGLTRPWNDVPTDVAFARQGPNSDVLLIAHPQIIASVMVGHDGHRGWVYYLAVEPNMQGQGLGRHVMDEAEAWLRTKGVWKVHLMVRRTNGAVRAFYEKLGFSESDVFVLSKSLT